MRIFIMGSGGTGGYYGSKLANAGHDVTFIARGAHLEAMRASGLKVVGRQELYLPQVQAVNSTEGLAPADLVIFAVKAYDTEVGIAAIMPIVGPGTTIVPIQNGVDSYDQLGAALGYEKVVGGLCRISAEIREPGVIQLNSDFTELVCGEIDGRLSDRSSAIAAVGVAAGFPCKASTHVKADLWKKFTFITAFSGITGATRLRIGPIRQVPETLAIFRSIAEEVVAVGRAEGVDLGDGFAASLERQAREDLAPGMKASLVVDLQAGKPTEVDTLQGTVVRLGKKHGVPTPVTEVIYALIKVHQPG